MRKILSTNQVEPLAQNAIANFHQDYIKEVEQALTQNEYVIVGMAQNPVCSKARKFLDQKNTAYKYIEYGSYFSMWKPRLALKMWSGWPTYPMVFHNGKLVGGCSELMKYFKS